MKKFKPALAILLIVMIFLTVNCPVFGKNRAYGPYAGQSGIQAGQLTARHYEGQTILTWDEVSEVAAAVSDTMTVQQIKNLRTSLKHISYRIYRSTTPITSVEGLSPIKTVGVLTGWDDEFYGRENSNINNQPCPRFVVESDTNHIPTAPVSATTAISAYNPESAGLAYYAVTVVRNGVEETLLDSDNTVSVMETVGQGIPILQKVTTETNYFYTTGISTHYYYTRWESPPNSNIQGSPADYKVIVPDSYVPGTPMPVYMSFHGWGSSMHSISAWWFNFSRGTIVITTNQVPYDWWTGYHEKYGIGERSQQNWASGVVRPYTQNRLSSFYDWAASQWSFDPNRTIAGGVSMGGSGSIMYGIRNPDRVAWVHSWVGVHIPAESPTFRNSYQAVYGQYDWQIMYEDGVNTAFDFYDDDWYLRNHVSDETPFITFSNGKNDSSIGWSQAVKFVNALKDTKRPFIFNWGMGGHNQRTTNPPDINGNRSQNNNPIDIRIDQSLPAFTNCSLDDDPGNGDVNDGDASGQINAYLYWETSDITDTPQRWEMTVGLVQTAPAQTCTVSLTPRRLQNFQAIPGASYRWSNTALSTNTLLQSGTVLCDSNGLITIDNLTVNLITPNGGGNRIVIEAEDSGNIPDAPVLTATAAGNRFAILSWDAVEDAEGYVIRYGTAPGDYTLSKTVGNVTQCTVTGLQNGTTYYFAAQALSAGGESSELSAEVSAQPVAVAENRPDYVKNENIVHPIIYVSNDGDNLINDGSENSPLRTIAYALQQAEPGDTIIVKPGIYYEYNIGSYAAGNEGGEENAWITVRSEVPYGAIIDALGTTDSEIIRCYEKDYMIFDGFEVRNSGLNVIHADNNSHDIIFRNILAHDAGPNGDVMKFNQSYNITVENCEAYNPGMRVDGASTVYQELVDFVDVDNATVRNSLFHDAGNIAIYSKGGSRNTVFENNIILGNTDMDDPADALVGIGGWTGSNYFVNGDVFESYDMIVRNNLIIGAKGEAIGVYNSSGARVYNNTIVNAGRAGIFFRMGNGPEGYSPETTDTQVFNNIFANTGGTMITPFLRQNNESSMAVTDFTHGNNLFWNNGQPIPSGDTGFMLAIGGDAITAENGSAEGNPRFLNANLTTDQMAEMSYDDIATLYSITAGSAAIGMVPRSGYAPQDFFGADRPETTDAGAMMYEAAQEIPEAPVLISAKEGDESVLLTWNVVQGAESYTIHYGTAEGAYTQSVSAGAAISYLVTGLTNGMQYYFAVTASNVHGDSPFSNELATTPKAVVTIVLGAEKDAHIRGYDTYYQPGDPNYDMGADGNEGNGVNLWLRTNRDPLDKSLLQFSLDEIPQDAEIRSATLRLYKYTEGTANAAAYRLTHDWTEGTGADEDNFRFLPNAGVTWNSYNGPDGRWTTPGGDYDLASEVAVILSSGAGWQEWDITGMAQAWHSNPEENYGVILVDKTTWNHVRFHSSEAAEADLRPQLVIEYMPSGSQQPDEMGLEIISSHSIVSPQQEFEIIIRATDALDLYAYLANFEYDPQKFELIGGQLAESPGAFTLLSDIGDPDGSGKLQILATLTGQVDGISGEAIDLVRLVFKPKLAAGAGSFTIKAGSSFSNSESQVGVLPDDMEIIVSIVSGYDLNNDGVTNIGDLVLVAAAVGSSAGDSGYQAILDLDGNNIINNADLQIIALVLLNKE